MSRVRCASCEPKAPGVKLDLVGLEKNGWIPQEKNPNFHWLKVCFDNLDFKYGNKGEKRLSFFEKAGE